MKQTSCNYCTFPSSFWQLQSVSELPFPEKIQSLLGRLQNAVVVKFVWSKKSSTHSKSKSWIPVYSLCSFLSDQPVLIHQNLLVLVSQDDVKCNNGNHAPTGKTCKPHTEKVWLVFELVTSLCAESITMMLCEYGPKSGRFPEPSSICDPMNWGGGPGNPSKSKLYWETTHWLHFLGKLWVEVLHMSRAFSPAWMRY